MFITEALSRRNHYGDFEVADALLPGKVSKL